jgi:hypothetical protein
MLPPRLVYSSTLSHPRRHWLPRWSSTSPAPAKTVLLHSTLRTQ